MKKHLKKLAILMALVLVAATIPTTVMANQVLTLSPSTITINNNNLTGTSTIGGTVTGNIVMAYTALPGITVAVDQAEGTITVTGQRPLIGQGEQISGSFTIHVLRGGRTQPLTVNVNLTPQSPTPPPTQPPATLPPLSQEPQEPGAQDPAQGATQDTPEDNLPTLPTLPPAPTQPPTQPEPALPTWETTHTVPVNGGTINLGAWLSTNSRNVMLDLSPLNTAAIISQTTGTNSFDMTDFSQATNVTFPRAALRTFTASSRPLTFALPQGTVSFNAHAANTLGRMARHNNVTITLEETTSHGLPAAQVRTLDNATGTIYRITAQSWVQTVSVFTGGEVTISIPRDDTAPATVQFVNRSGHLTTIPSQVSEDGYLTFTTNQLGIFLISAAAPMGTAPSITL